MAKVTPIFATDKTAAQLLDMPVAEFRELVRVGSLPPGREIAPGVTRWPVSDLVAICSGGAAQPKQEEFVL